MPISLNRNINSLKAQGALNKTSSELSKVYERLSSGLRINSAADDAAGLAISNSLRTDQKVFSQGIRNLNDGISALNIAEGAVTELGSIVSRIGELAGQAANGTYSAAQRVALDREAQALRLEYTRIAQSTKFNGMNLLNGSVQNLGLQGGYGSSGSINVNSGGSIGTGTFATAVTIAGVAVPYNIVSADFNNDGIVDLATVNSPENRVSVMLGTGGGAFAPRVTYTVSGTVTSLDIGDFNNDGIVDIAAAGEAGVLNLMLGTGSGTFSAHKSFSAGATSIYSIASGDFNGDGFDDVAFADFGTSKAYVAFGSGDGTLQPVRSFATGLAPQFISSADLNNDGLDDLVVSNGSDNNVSVLLANGSGGFAAHLTYATGTSPAGNAIGDVNGDGIKDIVVANSGGSQISILTGTGSGTFNAAVSLAATNGGYDVHIGDFNGDGKGDIAYGSSAAALAIYLANGSGGFSAPTTINIGGPIGTLITGDFNGDGIVDIAANPAASLKLLFGNSQLGAGPLIEFSLRTKAEARQAIEPLKRKADELSLQRGAIGAYQSRLSYAASNLGSTVENYAQAESRIRDADVASDVAEMVRLQILQQSATAMLAQANQQTSLVTSLLKL